MQTAVCKVQSALKKWDKGTNQQRKEILKEFIRNNKGKTAPEIEDNFSQSSSLFLGRVTAWLRLTYITGTCVTLQMKALHVFLSATAGHHFMAQFIEVGGVCTLLEIIGLKQSKDIDRTLALKILIVIAASGRQYKELICECYGIRTIAECLAKSKDEDSQQSCKTVLQLLGQGNPKYELQVYKSFIALLPCTSPKAQQLALQNLRISQKIVEEANPNLVEPLLNLLKTVHLEVQYEVIEFLKELLHLNLRQTILEGLVKALIPSREDLIQNPEDHKLIAALDNIPVMNGLLPAYVKQATAAKAIRILCKTSMAVTESILQLNVVPNLMFAMGNTEYCSSQKEASLTLEHLVLSFSSVKEIVLKMMGEELFRNFMESPQNFYSRLKAAHIDILTSSTNYPTFF